MEHSGGVEEEVDAFFWILSADVGDDGDVGEEIGELGLEQVEGRGLAVLGQLDAWVDGAEARLIDAHFVAEAEDVVAADGDGRPG